MGGKLHAAVSKYPCVIYPLEDRSGYHFEDWSISIEQEEVVSSLVVGQQERFPGVLKQPEWCPVLC